MIICGKDGSKEAVIRLLFFFFSHIICCHYTIVVFFGDWDPLDLHEGYFIVEDEYRMILFLHIYTNLQYDLILI